MTREDLSSRYFEWLCGIVFDGRYLKGRSYSKLFELLHSVDFEVVIGMDQNRAEDGIDLRYRFGDEQGYIQPMIASLIDNVPCSVLEMMVALSFQCENTMSDPEEGNRLYTISGLRAIGFYITEKAVIKVNRLIKQTILASIVILLAICCF